MRMTAEDRRLKFVGLAIAATGFGLLGWLIEQSERQWPPPADALWSWLATAVLGMNLMVAGLVIMAAGFGVVRPGADARRRRAVLLQLLLANVVLPVLFLGFWFDDPRTGAAERVDALQVALALGGYVLAFAAWRLWRRSQRHAAPSAAEVLAADPLPPVLYLRSFRDDGTVWLDSEQGRLAQWWSKLLAFRTTEEQCVAALQAVGPVVAIGKPGEPIPELGAARLYVGHDAWQSEVRRLMDRAALVVVRIGTSPGVLWEIEQALMRLPRERLVFALIGEMVVSEEVAARLAPELGAAWQEALPRPRQRASAWRRSFRWWPSEQRIGALICFPDGRPRLVPVQRRSAGSNGAAWWRRLMISGTRLVRPLQAAWREVLALLGVQTREEPSRIRAIAIGLALTFGAFGAHWLYLGRYRRGIAYVALLPVLGLSLILAWYDALRFIWFDRAEFERSFVRRQGSELRRRGA